MARHLGDQWMLPALEPGNREWYTAGVLRVQHCSACGGDQHPPEDVCCSCQSTDLGFRDCGSTGRVESAVVVHHATHPSLKERVPYTVVVVSLDDAPGCNAIGNVVDAEPGGVEIGQAVTAVFETVEDEATGETLRIPLWRKS